MHILKATIDLAREKKVDTNKIDNTIISNLLETIKEFNLESYIYMPRLSNEPLNKQYTNDN